MRSSPSRFHAFLVAISIALAIVVAVLATQNVALKRTLAAERADRSQASRGKAEARFATGERVPPIALLARDGSVEHLDFASDGHGALLLFYAEACNVCPQVFVSWEELAPLFASEGVRVAAVQLDRKHPDDPYAPPGVASYALADFASVPIAKVATVPVTLLVDARSVVRWVRYGTLTPDDMQALVSCLPESDG